MFSKSVLVKETTEVAMSSINHFSWAPISSYVDSHDNDKTVVSQSYLYQGYPCIGKTASLLSTTYNNMRNVSIICGMYPVTKLNRRIQPISNITIELRTWIINHIHEKVRQSAIHVLTSMITSHRKRIQLQKCLPEFQINQSKDCSNASEMTLKHCSDVIMSAMAFQITSVCSPVCSGADQRKYQGFTSLPFVRRIRRWPVVPLTNA